MKMFPQTRPAGKGQHTRRGWLASGAALAFASAFGPRASADEKEQEKPNGQPPPKDGAEALLRLKEGNRRFAEGRVRHAHEAASWRKHLKVTQAPFATILACSDSRVPPELVFDQGFGDLFVIRVAGNVVASDVVGSIQYALAHLRTPLLLVMGHEGCGAVTAAVEAFAGRANEPKYINALLERIEPGLKELPAALEGPDRVHAAVEANVRWTLQQLTSYPEARRVLKDKAFTFAGAVYELDTGRVRFLE